VLLNFEAQAEGVDPDDVLLKVLDAVPEKAEESAAMAKAG
jgi:MoxR-like ATPase